jgi:hypothetical protein
MGLQTPTCMLTTEALIPICSSLILKLLDSEANLEVWVQTTHMTTPVKKGTPNRPTTELGTSMNFENSNLNFSFLIVLGFAT